MRTSGHIRGLLLLTAAGCAISGTARANPTCYLDNAGRIVQRQRPGYKEVPCPPQNAPGQPPTTVSSPDSTVQRPFSQPGPLSQQGPERAPPATVSPIPVPGVQSYSESVPVRDRWRIVDALGYTNNLLDPYNRNILKADKPVYGDWFFNLGLLSDSVYQNRNIPTAVGGGTSVSPGSNDVFGRDGQQAFSQNVALELVYYKGDTTFRPPDYEFRFTPVFNYNYLSAQELGVVNADPRAGLDRSDHFTGIQAAFVDKHLRDVSDDYDFDSLRVGIQPFSSDFRGFLFQDDQPGIRLYGTRDDNRYQYNIAWFRRTGKDTNSGLNDIYEPLRRDDIFVADLFRQDLPVPGFTSQAIVLHDRDREAGRTSYNTDGFLVVPSPIGIQSPRNYDVTYLGYNGDGHFGRVNLTTALYYAIGSESRSIFVARETQVRAYFGALELSVDRDWVRARLSLAYGSGDRNPYGTRDTGFDAVLQNPQFAGADTSYWIRQAVPLIGGGGVMISPGNSMLNDLRPSADEGQSNFTNPGVMLAGVGADADLLPTLRVSFNANELYFAETRVLEVARDLADVPRNIGADLSVSLTWRPLLSQNIVVRTSYARLIAGDGFETLYPHTSPGYFLFNLLFAY
jgi:hypothetical protein